ncbi:MAG TPA: metallopeptidase TldD-related protein, partial [Dehalococcoidia bacterium]
MPDSDSPGGIDYMRQRFGIDEAAAQSLLDTALAGGGDYAELYFEHKNAGNIQFEQQAVKSANRAVTQGLGVRVLLGEAVGYAYTEDLSRDAMRRAAETAAKIASRGERLKPADSVHYETASHYSPSASTVGVAPADKVALLRRADDAARAYDRSIARVDISVVDELKNIAIFTSDGRMAGDVQPLVRFNVSCLSERDGRRQTARWGGGGRMGMAYFDEHSPEDLAREAARQATLLQSAIEAPAGTFPVVLAAGDSGILLHEAIGHGLEADFNRKKTSNYSDRIGEVVASELCTIVDDGTIRDSRGSINVDDEGNLPGYNVLI